eukprot:1152652-Pelagomonas_calceolata.AAC.5
MNGPMLSCADPCLLAQVRQANEVACAGTLSWVMILPKTPSLRPRAFKQVCIAAALLEQAHAHLHRPCSFAHTHAHLHHPCSPAQSSQTKRYDVSVCSHANNCPKTALDLRSCALKQICTAAAASLAQAQQAKELAEAESRIKALAAHAAELEEATAQFACAATSEHGGAKTQAGQQPEYRWKDAGLSA